MKIKLGTALRVIISAAALGLIGWFLRGKLGQAFVILKTEVELPIFFIAVGFYFFSIVVLSLRMQFILRFKGIIFGFIQNLYLCFLGIFFSTFLPSAIGGDVMKAVYLVPHAQKKADVFSCLVMDRLSGFCVVIFFALLSSVLLRESWNPVPLWISVACLITFLLSGISFLVWPKSIQWVFSKLRFLPPKLQEKLNQFYDSLAAFFHDRPFLIGSLLISLAGQTLFITSYYFLGQSLQAEIPWTRFFILVPMITIISMTPSVGGVGVRELGAAALFRNYMPEERAAALTILLAVLIYAHSFLGGIWYLLRGHRDKMPQQVTPDNPPQNS